MGKLIAHQYFFEPKKIKCSRIEHVPFVFGIGASMPPPSPTQREHHFSLNEIGRPAAKESFN